MTFFFEVLINGLLVGIMYSLVALGFALIYKASDVFNMAQGAMSLLAGLALVGFLELNFPLWFAPTQVKLIAVSEKHIEYCEKLAAEFRKNDIRIEVDSSDETVGNKIRKAIGEKVPYMLVIGDKEAGSDNSLCRANE